MTIRFLMAWNGHSPDEINSSLGAVEESRLVGLGFATYDLDGANDGQEVAVFAKSNPLTGGIKDLYSGRSPILQHRSTIVPWQLGGAGYVSGTANATRHLSAVLPFRPSAVRATIFHAHNSSQPVYKVAFATTADPFDPIMNSATWELFKWAGADTVTPPVADVADTTIQTMGKAVSDIMHITPAEYGAGTIIGLRSHASLSNNTFFGNSDGAKTSLLTDVGAYVAFQGGVDGVGTPAAFTTPIRTTAVAKPPVMLEFWTAAQTRNIGLFGSSTTSGTGDTVSFGWWARAERSQLRGGLLNFVNYAYGGAPSVGNINRFLNIADTIPLDAAVLNVYTLNDADRKTDAGMRRLIYQQDMWIAECRKRGIWPILMTWQHSQGATGADYANAKICNEAARARASAGLCGVFDAAAILTDESAAVGTWRNSAWTTDNIHPNALGHDVLAAAAPAVFAAL